MYTLRFYWLYHLASFVSTQHRILYVSNQNDDELLRWFGDHKIWAQLVGTNDVIILLFYVFVCVTLKIGSKSIKSIYSHTLSGLLIETLGRTSIVRTCIAYTTHNKIDSYKSTGSISGCDKVIQSICLMNEKRGRFYPVCNKYFHIRNNLLFYSLMVLFLSFGNAFANSQYTQYQ